MLSLSDYRNKYYPRVTGYLSSTDASSQQINSRESKFGNNDDNDIFETYGIIRTGKKSAEETILVEIAAYKESEIVNTVRSCVIQADNPEKIYFAICYQDDDMTKLEELKKIDNCKIMHVMPEDSKGLCWARYCCQQMLENETYILHLDAHMRMVKHWDAQMINEWKNCHDEYAILSTHPADARDVNAMKIPLDSPVFDQPVMSTCIKAEGDFYDNSFFIGLQSWCIGADRYYEKVPFIAGGYLFAKSHFDKNVISNPDMYFIGDELPVAINAYTHGYNVYNAKYVYAYHQYYRGNRLFAEGAAAKRIMASESIILRTMLGVASDNEKVDLGKFGLGNKRTLAEFEEFAGVDFKKRLIYKKAVTGDFNRPCTELSDKCKARLVRDEKQICVLLYAHSDLAAAAMMADCLKTAACPDRIFFMIYCTHDNPALKYLRTLKNAKLVISYEKWTYGKAMHNLVKEMPTATDYVITLDTNVRPSMYWDRYYVSRADEAGKNVVLGACMRTNRDYIDKDIFAPYANCSVSFSGIDSPYVYVCRNAPISDGYNESCYFLTDVFMFAHVDIVRDVAFDDRLSFKGILTTYPLKLWDAGYDIQYTPMVYFTRVGDFESDALTVDAAAECGAIYDLYDVDAAYKYEGHTVDIKHRRSITYWLHKTGINPERIKGNIRDDVSIKPVTKNKTNRLLSQICSK